MINTDLVTDVSTPSTIPGSDTQVGIEINPAVAELGSNLGSGDTVVSAPRPTVRTFQPSNSLEPMLEKAGNIVSLGAYLTEESLYRAIYDGLEEPEFQRDSTFDAAKTLQQDREAVKLNPDFHKELLGSVSNDDYQYRWGRIKDKQIAQTAMSEAPVGAFVGAVMDADLLLGLGVTKAVRIIGLATRIGAPYALSVIAGTKRSLAAGGAVLGGTVVGSTSYALGRSNEHVLWDAVGGAVGGLLDGFTAAPKVSRVMPTVNNPRPVVFDDTTDAIVSGKFNRPDLDLQDSPVPYYKGASGKRVRVEPSSAGHVTREVQDISEVGKYSRLVKSGRLVLPKDTPVVYIPEEDALYITKGALGTPEGQGALLRELGARATASRVLGKETVLDMIDHVQHLAAAGNSTAKAALDFASNAPDLYKGITALGRYVELNAANVNDSVINRLLVSVREWLRGMGVHVQYTDTDLVQMIRKSMKEVPEHGSYPNKGIVYHGTTVRGIDQLRMQYAKSGEGAQAFGYGHYVTTDEGLAAAYKANVGTIKGVHPEAGTVYALRRNFDDSEVVDFDSTVQPQKVTEVFNQHGITSGTGKDMYNALSAKLGSDKAASDALVAGGVKGNKYKTGRARKGKGDASNYVVFEDSGLTLIRDLSVNGRGAKTGAVPSSAGTGSAVGTAGPVGGASVPPSAISQSAVPPNSVTAPVGSTAPAGSLPSTADLGAETVPLTQREAISTFNPGFKQYVASWDKLNAYSPDLANKLLANPMDDVAESAVVWGRSTWLEADRALYGLEQAIKAEVPRWKSWFPQTRARARAETAELGRAARQWLNNAQQIEARGGTPVPPTDPRVKRIVDAYTEGNFGTIMGTRAQEAGVFGADALSPSKYYVPVRHSYLKMQEFVAQGKGSWTDLHKMYGQQIARIYPRLITPVENGGLGLSPEALGKKFVYTQKLRQADPKAQAFRGTTQDELAEVLRAEGVEEGKIKGLLSTLQPKADEAGKQKNLRTRMDWDYEGTYLGSKGQVMSINEFMDDDLLGSLQTYARNMSGRIGLARVGFTKESDLDDAIGKALDNLPAAERQKAQEFFGNVKAQLLGQPVGEAAPDWFRTLTSYGASTQLGNSGVYAIADYAQLVNEFGVSTVAKHFLKSLSGVINAKSITKEQAETIQQVISGQLFAEGRVRPYVTHLEDNWVGPAGSIHEVAQYGGQYIKYLNGSEFMRRHQINAVAGIMDELVGNLADVRKAQDSAKYFKSLNMSDTDIAAATAQVQRHGTVIDNWDAAVKTKMMNTLISATDNIAITIRAGEQPAFIEHSAIGRVLFPYMRYVFGANQKILRRNYKRNGAMGVALYMSAAIPLSVVSGMMSNIVQGRDPEEDLVARTIRSLPGLGVASLAADGFMQGDVGGTAPVFAGPNNLFQMVDKLKRGELEVQDVLKAVPGANVFIPTRWLINSTKED